MATARFTEFPTSSTQASIQEHVKSLGQIISSKQTLISTTIGTQNTTEIVSEAQTDTATTKIHDLFGPPSKKYHVVLNRSLFGPSGAVTRPITEYVQTYFPASRITPAFQKQIEDDFERFNSLAFSDADAANGGDYAFGWVVEQQEHEEIQGEKTRSFFMARAWDSMELFQRFMQTDEARENLPILMGWGAPFRMVSRFLH